jgi:hypothetical protein
MAASASSVLLISGNGIFDYAVKKVLSNVNLLLGSSSNDNGQYEPPKTPRWANRSGGCRSQDPP